MRVWSALKSFRVYLGALDFQPVEEEVREYADWCLARCTEWFGKPPDLDVPLEVVYGPHSCCNLMPGRYTIMISRAVAEDMECHAHVGHEIYHRATGKFRGLHRQVWVDEMLANLTADHLLDSSGHSDYASHRRKYYARQEVVLTLEKLRRVRRRTWRELFGASAYPGGLTGGVGVLGMKLESIVGWSHLTALVKCQTWNEWLEPLDHNQQDRVKVVLDLK